jgi:hypothetical protein
VTEDPAWGAGRWPAGAAWIDGRYCPVQDAKISVLDLGVTRSARNTFYRYASHEDPQYSTPVRYSEPDGTRDEGPARPAGPR